MDPFGEYGEYFFEPEEKSCNLKKCNHLIIFSHHYNRNEDASGKSVPGCVDGMNSKLSITTSLTFLLTIQKVLAL